MDTLLIGLVSECLSKAVALGLTASNKIVLAVGSTQNETALIYVSAVEPTGPELPLNFMWIVSDSNSADYQKILRRTSKTANFPYQNTYEYPTVYANVINTFPVYDAVDGFIRPALENHRYSVGNAHAATPTQIGAVNINGDTMLGVLRARANWRSVPLQPEEFIPLQKMTDSLNSQTQGFYTILMQLFNRIGAVETTNAQLAQRITALETTGGGQIDPNLVPRTYVHEQAEAEPTWIINHNLGTQFLIVQHWVHITTPDGIKLELAGAEQVVIVNDNFVLIDHTIPATGIVVLLEAGLEVVPEE
jgi:hypothetical protein